MPIGTVLILFHEAPHSSMCSAPGRTASTTCCSAPTECCRRPRDAQAAPARPAQKPAADGQSSCSATPPAILRRRLRGTQPAPTADPQPRPARARDPLRQVCAGGTGTSLKPPTFACRSSTVERKKAEAYSLLPPNALQCVVCQGARDQ